MNRKFWLVPLMAATMLFCGTFAAFAGESGWQKNSDGVWMWYDSNGNYVTSIWKKGGDNEDRYLDSNGAMAVDAWVDDGEYTYYVDQDGKKVKDVWKQLTEPNASDTNNEYWYYFSTNGRLLKGSWKKTNNKWYHVDDDGRLQYGWILDNMYYADENGVMLTGWQKLEDPTDTTTDTKDNTNLPYVADEDEGSGVHYYYFSSNGKKFVPTDLSDGSYGERKVDGKRYCFDSNGARQYGWVNLSGSTGVDQSIKDYKYYNEDGTVRTGWYSLNPPEDLNTNYSADVVWFYFNPTGEPKAASSNRYHRSEFTKINNKTYLFNEYGTPLYGLQKVYNTSSDNSDYNAYYFGSANQCTMKSGKVNIKEGDDEKYNYYFTSTGGGFTGVHDGYLYYMGKPQKADTNSKYEIISLPKSGDNYSNYVVNTSGKIVKKTTVKDKDGVKLTTGSDGELLKMDDSTDGIKGHFNEPEEPDWENVN